MLEMSFNLTNSFSSCWKVLPHKEFQVKDKKSFSFLFSVKTPFVCSCWLVFFFSYQLRILYMHFCLCYLCVTLRGTYDVTSIMCMLIEFLHVLQFHELEALAYMFTVLSSFDN